MVIDKEKMFSNIKELVEGEFYFSLYQRLFDGNELKNSEKNSAELFNVIFLMVQLEEDVEVIKKLVVSCFENGITFSYGMITTYFFEHIIPQLLREHDDYYLEDTRQRIIERLYHGWAVHFTTVPIMEKIQKDGYFSSSNSMFSVEEEKKILEASRKQIAMASEEEKAKCLYLTSGFGFAKGISMGAQTVPYWMNHTPESLSFLFGGNVYTRNKNGAMSHVKLCITHLSLQEQEEIMNILSDIWDRLIGKEPRLGAVLIDRDGLEYQTVTYWNEEPPRVEEVSPYYQGSFYSLSSSEDNRYSKDISCSALRFVKVPSVFMLEDYCKSHDISPEDKIRDKYSGINSMIDYDNEFDLSFSSLDFSLDDESGYRR